MSHFKRFIFKLFTPVSHIFSLSNLIRKTDLPYFVPLYHSIQSENQPHLKHLYPLHKISTFQNELDILLKYYSPVELDELVKIVRGEKVTSKFVFHLTFDDGLKEFYTLAAPLLRKKGIPATCFINSDCLDNKKLMYRHLSSILIDRFQNYAQDLNMQHGYSKWALEHGFYNKFDKDVLLSVPYSQKHSLEKLALYTGFDMNDFLQNNRPYLTTSQINELISEGFTFGAHSVDHPDFRFISEEEQYNQIKLSIEYVHRKFRLGYRAFSFPFTDDTISNRIFKRITEENIVDITFGCAGVKKDSAKHHIQRTPVEVYPEPLITSLRKEYLYYKFLAITGRSKIKRPD